MKIGIIHQFLDLIGGAERSTFALTDTLKDTNHEVTLYTTTHTDISESKNFRIKKIHSTIPYLWKLKKNFENKKIYSNLKDEELIIIMDGGFAFRHVPKKKILLYCHSTFEYEKKFIHQKIPGWRGILYKIIQKDLTSNLNHLKEKNVQLVSNSQFTSNKIKTLFDVNSKIIYPPINLELFFNNIKKEEKVVTIVRYSPEKNLSFLAEVSNKSEVRFDIIGNSKLKQIKFYEKIKNDTNIQDKVNLYNNISRESLKKILFSAKVYFHPSVETFGISVVEGIASGCIPIVPDNSANKETVPFSELRYNENDVGDAVLKIRDAISGKYDKFIPKLRDHVKKFDIKEFQKKMIELVESD